MWTGNEMIVSDYTPHERSTNIYPIHNRCPVDLTGTTTQ